MITNSKFAVDEASLKYQARTRLAELAGEIASTRSLNRSSDKVLQATKIRLWLKALDLKSYLTREQRERIWYALIQLSGVYDFPVAPVLSNNPRPSILSGGLASDIQWGAITGNIANQGDLTAALSGKVNRTGDVMTGNLSFSSAGLNLPDFIQFDLTPATYTPAIGNMGWNDTEGTIDLLLKGGVVNLPLGQKQVARVVNGTAGNVLKSNYQVVKVTGAQGQRLQVNLAQANNDANSADTLGLIAENINNNQTGFIITSGLIEEINTTGSLQGETWVDGNVLYLSPTVAGRITNIKPQAPNHTVIVGFVVYAHANHGKIFVKIDNGYELDELHNVKINTGTLANGQVLKYNSSLSVWENNSDAGITGSGTTDYVPKFATSSTLNDSIIRTSGTDTVYFSTRTGGSSGDNLFIGDGGQLINGFGSFGARNTSVGQSSMVNSTLGKDNTAFGFSSLQNATDGLENTAIGSYALQGNNGASNTSVGYYSGIGFLGNYSTSIGASSLAGGATATGSYNTALGRRTLISSSLSGTYNIGIGESAGKNNTSGSQNIYIGADTSSGPIVTNQTGSNNVFIGHDARPVSISESNRTFIGNTSTTSTWLGGNLLLGSTTNTSQRLQVTGNAIIRGEIRGSGVGNTGSFISEDTQAGGATIRLTSQYGLGIPALLTDGSFPVVLATNNTEALRISTTQNLLLGTTTDLASSILTMASTTKGFLRPRMSTAQRDAIVSPATGLSVYNTSTNKVNYYNGTAWTEIQDTITNPVTGTGTSGQVAYWNGTTTQTGSNNLFWDAANNRLGVGTNAPSFALQVQSDSQINGLRIGKGANSISTNTAIGVNTLSSITTGNNNTSIGSNSGLVISSGSRTTSIGSESLIKVTTGDWNTAVGFSSLSEITTTSNNVAIGYNSGRFITDGTANQISNNSTYLGFDTRASANGNTNEIVIGYQGRGLGSNTSVIGNSSTTFGRWWGNLLIGSSVNGGQALQVTGDTLLKGSGNTSGTTALTVQNSDGISFFRARNDGTINFGGSLSTLSILPQQNNVLTLSNDVGFRFLSSLFTTQTGFDFYFNNGQGARIVTSGSNGFVAIQPQSFSPTSGTGTFTTLQVNQTINQTGGANGITRGLYVNPTLTAAADWRSIEWSNNTGWGLYGAGTANNYLAGSLGIGSTSLTNHVLRLSKNVTGATTSYSLFNEGIIQSDVTGQAFYFRTQARTQATSFTLGNLFHYGTLQDVFGLGSSVTNQFGFHVSSSLTGATNNYGFYGDIASGTGRWNLYMNGTADNYLAGSLGIGTTSLTGRRLYVSGNLTGSSQSSAISSESIIQSDVTGIGHYFVTFARTQAASFTLSDLYHYRASQGTFGLGSAVTTQYGYSVDSSLTGATNNFGFYGNIASGTGRWNLYMNGTANNYLAGNLAIGGTTIDANQAIQVNSSRGIRISGVGGGFGYSIVRGTETTVIANNGSSSEILATNAFVFYTAATERLRIFSNGNVGIGVAGTDAGFKLDVNGTARVQSDVTIKGSGSDSGTFPLTVQISDATSVLRVRGDKKILIGSASTSAAPSIYAFTGITGDRSLRIGIQSAASLTPTPAFNINQENDYTYTTGTGEFTTITANFLPTSGTGALASLVIRNTINQTGGANGITRGLYVNPTLTSAADWRSIEWGNNTGWGLYGAGTANNYLAGSLGIGTTSVSFSNLHISKNITGGSSCDGIRVSSTVQSDNSSAQIYLSVPAVQNTAFTLSNLYHFYALQGSFGASAVVTNQNGFFAGSNLIGATNNYGFRGLIPSGTGRWNLYMDGTALNYLNGSLLIGTTTDAGFKLDVNGTARVVTSLRVGADGNTFTSITNGLFGISRTSDGAITAAIDAPTALEANRQILRASGRQGVQLAYNTAARIQAFEASTTIGLNTSFDTTLTNDTSTVLRVEGSKTAASAIARGVNLVNTLVASANNDVLVGLDINPTFTIGAFTGVSNLGLRLVNSQFRIDYGSSGALTISNLGTNTFGASLRFSSTSAGSASSASFGLWDGTRINGFFGHGGSNSNLGFSVGGAQVGAWFSNGNLFVGSSPTDAGFKLDVNGTARVSGALSIGTGLQLSDTGGVSTITSLVNNAVYRTQLIHRFQVTASNTDALAINNTGNVLINTLSDAGFKLDVNGTARITPPADSVGLTLSGYSLTGSNAQSAIDISGTWNTTGSPSLIKANVTNTASGALSRLVQLQVGGNSNLEITRSGTIIFGTFGASFGAIGSSLATSPSGTTRGTSIYLGGSVAGNEGYGIWLAAQAGTRTPTTGVNGHIATQETFNPTSGTASYNIISIQNTINQTGGANGITRGLYVNPTLTAAADWRSIEWSNNTGWGLYGAGTANNYLGGRLGIGSTSLTDNNLVIGRSITGSSQAGSVVVNGTIQSDVTGSSFLYGTYPSVVNQTFTLSNLYHYGALFNTKGASATITNQYGFWADQSLTTATNNYGFYGNIPSGTNRWNLYMNGTANNYLAGDLAIGGTTIDANYAIQVNSSKGIRISGSGGGFGYTIVRGTETTAIANNGSSTEILSTNNLIFYTNSTERLRIRSNGNLLIGTTTDAGFKLDVNGTARITPPANSVGLTLSGYSLTGSNAQSAVDISGTWNTTGTPSAVKINVTDTASNSNSRLLDIQLNGTTTFLVRKDGAVAFGGNTLNVRSVSGTFRLSTGASTTNDYEFATSVGNKTYTSGTASVITTDISFAPTSGTGVFQGYQYNGTINQTGGANGITRGLFVNPTLTAAADWRSIETSNNTGYALYLGGSADAFFNDATDFQFGTTTGTKIGTSTSQKLGFWNATPIVQPTTGVASATRVGGGGTALTDTDTFDGYTLAQIVKALRNTGILA